MPKVYLPAHILGIFLIAWFAVTSASPTSLSQRAEASTTGANAIPQIPASFTVGWVSGEGPLIPVENTLAVVLHAMNRYGTWDYEGQVANLRFAYLGLAITVKHTKSAESPRFENRFAMWGLLLCIKQMLGLPGATRESYSGGICTLSNSGVRTGQIAVEVKQGSENEQKPVVTTLLELDGQSAGEGDGLLIARAEAAVEGVGDSADVSVRIFPGGRKIGVVRFYVTIYQAAITLADRYRTRSERLATDIGTWDIEGDGEGTILRLRSNALRPGGPNASYFLATNGIMKLCTKMRDFARGRDWLETDFVVDFLWRGSKVSPMKGGLKSSA